MRRPIYTIMVVYLCSLQFFEAGSRKNFISTEAPVKWTICKTFPGLNKAQQNVCRTYPDVTAIAMQGLEQAVDECQYQFRSHRWNCSSLRTKNKNPHSSVLLKKGFRESAFSYAIASAGVTHSVAKACSMGKLMACGCEPKTPFFLQRNARMTTEQRLKRLSRTRWKWGGCSHNMDFGLQFSKSFLDDNEKNSVDMQSFIKLHNSEAGRLAVSTQMQVKCKCHGMSGSCQLKTCWRSAPEFRVVGNALKDRFRDAIKVNQSNQGNGLPLFVEQNNLERNRRSRDHKGKRRRKRIRKNERDLSQDLLYYQDSPTFCDRDPRVDFPGTTGRICNRKSRGMDNCSSLCCGRGFSSLNQTRVEKCKCRFQWCCYVICEKCVNQEWVTVCN
ncbi:protein Wnt-10a-like [Planococcus citri]|uniref:protein Wnt-10a-like n=1 Tax=Planococcus citri TaxID=170843 RepID=UPI0031F89EAE